MRITICCGSDRWFNKFIHKYKVSIQKKIKKIKKINIVREANKIRKSDINFIISFGEILTKKELSKSKFNVVFHCSNLPKGRGSSPITWEVLSGQTSLTLSIFDADEGIDSGEIIEKVKIKLNGTEMLDEIHLKIYKAMVISTNKILDSYPKIKKVKQIGKASYYKKRFYKDSEVSINSKIKDIFNLLRIVDDEKYPVHFNYRKNKYKLILKKIVNEKN